MSHAIEKLSRHGDYSDSAIGMRIAALRRSRDLTQRELGDMIGALPDSVSSWERGRASPRSPTIWRLCQEFEVGADVIEFGVTQHLRIGQAEALKPYLLQADLDQKAKDAATEAREALRRDSRRPEPDDPQT